MRRVVHLHPAAPSKPRIGAPCNGCGVCCAVAPCPLGVLVSRRTHGRCDALGWSEPDGRYRCRLVSEPEAHLPAVLQRVAPLVARVARRSISAGTGCDCAWQPTDPAA